MNDNLKDNINNLIFLEDQSIPLLRQYKSELEDEVKNDSLKPSVRLAIEIVLAIIMRGDIEKSISEEFN